MKKKLAIWAAVTFSLAAASMLHAHHSSSMFDISNPIWVKGTVVDYKAVNPHATMLLEEEMADGDVRRWTIEGPRLGRIARMGVEPKVGDIIEVCGFNLREGLVQRESSPDPYGMSGQFAHGHVLLMPDGHWELFGAYGSLAECLRSSDEQRTSWLDFLNDSDPSVRELWCGQRRFARQGDLEGYPTELVEEINDSMAEPCE